MGVANTHLYVGVNYHEYKQVNHEHFMASFLNFSFFSLVLSIILLLNLNVIEDKNLIINGGTNNFTKTNQTPEEISNEIFEIVEMCKRGGLKHIFVSSITCRPSYQLQINEVNKLLEKNAGYYGCDYIDNVCIGETHLRNDGVHLNNQGITILANNFLNNLNRPSVIYPFSSIWD